MIFDVTFVLIVLGIAIIVISLELVAIDLVAMSMIVAVVAAGIITPAEAFSGFSSDVIIVLAMVFVIAGTVSRAGLAEAIADLILKTGRKSERAGLAVVMGLSAGMSTVLSNTSTTSVLTPAVLTYAKRSGLSASRVLMPLAFASLMGGTMTLIGTSTNLSASGMVTRLGLEPYGFFEFTAIGCLLALAGGVFMLFPGRALIPDRRPLDLTEDYGMRGYLSELVFPEGSKASGSQIVDLDLEALELVPLAVLRGARRLSAHPLRRIEAGDRMMVKGTVDGLLRARDDKRFEIEPETKAQEAGQQSKNFEFSEAIIMPQSRLVGRQLGNTVFFRRYRLIVLAVHRKGRAFATQLNAFRLQAGDVLLLQGATDDLAALRGHPDLCSLAELSPPQPTFSEGLLALGLLGLSAILASTGILPLSIGLLGSVVLLALIGIVPVQEAYRMIDWRLLVMIAGMTGFGLAMYESGAADLIAEGLITMIAPFGVSATLLALGILTVILTQPMSNAAAALAVLPVAMSTADALGIDPRPAAILVTLAASLSFIAPLEPALLIVHGPGRYRFLDFLKVGGPLTLLMLVMLVFLVPLFWPLTP